MLLDVTDMTLVMTSWNFASR